ncbi:hypothetical protein N7490_011335 [Penicillium lividum]|nr:hypothetical protein N7490_011335 [Penicillium lividum]
MSMLLKMKISNAWDDGSWKLSVAVCSSMFSRWTRQVCAADSEYCQTKIKKFAASDVASQILSSKHWKRLVRGNRKWTWSLANLVGTLISKVCPERLGLIASLKK